MDRHSSWSGTPGLELPGRGAGRRGRRVPPRVGQARGRRGARTATWDGASRWWWAALGTLAALLVLPRVVAAQGLRSPIATISLHVEAPAHLRAGATSRAVALRLGDSVADASLTLDDRVEDASRVDLRLDQPTGESLGSIFVRNGEGALVPLTGAWTPAGIARHGQAPILRVV